jgi:hypothetical protein
MTAVFAVVIAVLVSVTAAPSSEAATPAPPQVDREASEAAFIRAYDHFLQNRLWNALDELHESIRQNVYFVDAYYMRSLVLRRLGRYTDAIAAMSEYLEVRKDDHRGGIILGTMTAEWDLIRRTLNSGDVPPGLSFDAQTFSSFLKIPLYDPVSLGGMYGIGKLASSGDYIFLCDTFGDKLWIFDRAAGVAMNVASNRPAVLMPLMPVESLLFSEDGSLKRIKLDPTSRGVVAEDEGAIGGGVADAALIDSTFFAVADRRGSAVRFYGLPSLEATVMWRPPDAASTEKMFEPVAVSTYGSLLSVADRGNGRVYVIDSYTLSVLDEFDVPSPRDLEWGVAGELYILSEEWTLYSRHPIGAVSQDVTSVSEKFPDAWSMTWDDGGPLITNVSGRMWWSGAINPGRSEAFGAVALHNPWIEEQDGTETLLLRGAASSVFHDFIRNKTPMTQVVWRGEVRPSRIIEVGASNEGAARFYSPTGGITLTGERIVTAGAIADVMQDIAEVSRSGGHIPRVIVLDTRISGTEEQMALFLAFLLQQGVRLDLWSIARPASPMLCHISRITLGSVYYTWALGNVPLNDTLEWVLSVPLPPDVVTFGYPSDATLSLFSDIDVIRFTDWVPIWPSLIRK